ncbi:hypothetical protein PMO31116_02667 [Pandoraea morbifera]|uniref:Uncharacterized protein n=1 Tax=Pandoraea morbifera TaxID=2508300 RepID=A0A5E4VK19_9BURK|nr:DUF5677 domain-containing protein [Pandoraea morbifera]VVE12223.1 hypothetical protein PMO31116_02667 [Pandoraea morbifera]
MDSVEELESDPPLHEWPEWDWFDQITDLLKRTVRSICDRDMSTPAPLYPLLDSIDESADSLAMLIRLQRLRDSYVLSRVIYETAVNVCFLLVDPGPLSERAYSHARQKSLRNLTRAIKVAGTLIFKFEPEGAKQFLNQSTHKTWLTEFTSKSGREITSWTPENVQQRLDAIYLKFGESKTRGLAFGLLIYRNASEIAHGTLFGTLFSWGAMEVGHPLCSKDDIGKFRRKELRHMMKLVSYSLESLIRVVSSVMDEPDVDVAAANARTAYYERRGM